MDFTYIVWPTYGLLVKPTITMCSVQCVVRWNGIISQHCVGIFLIVLLRPSPDEFGKYAIVHDYAVVFNEANRRVYTSYID